jgi:peptide/nickel transport system substrate-binding protein
MASEEFKREYGQHLVDQVIKGQMTRRQLLVRASVFGFSLTAAGQLLAACGSSGGGATVSSPSASGSMPAVVMGGALKAVIPPPLKALDPVTIYDQGGIILVYQICEYLIDLDNTNKLIPKLATSWSPNSKGDVWTFKLRQGVKFNDGSPFEAADVVSTMDIATNPKSGSGAAAALKGILSTGHTVAVDASTVQFNLDKPFADFPYLVCSASYNTAMLPRNYSGNFLKNPVGTGPWLLKTYVANQTCTMVKNPTYWGKDAQGRQLPYLDSVVYSFVTDTSAANLQLQSHAVDVQPQTVFQGGKAVLSDQNLRVDVYPSTGIRELAMNTTKAPWTDSRVRQAVAYSLDRPAINQALYGGRSNLGYDSLWEPTVFPGWPAPAPRAQDYTKAKQLLTDAGHANGIDVTLTVANYLENPTYAQLIQAQCKPAGINVTIDEISYNAYYGGTQTGGASGYGNTPWLNAAMDITEWGSRPTPGQFAQAMLLPDSVWNSSNWKNAQFNSLFNQYESTADMATRSTLAGQLSSLMQQETPVVIAFYISQLRTQWKNVYNVQGPGSFYFNVSQAYMTKA